MNNYVFPTTIHCHELLCSAEAGGSCLITCLISFFGSIVSKGELQSHETVIESNEWWNVALLPLDMPYFSPSYFSLR